ncbi:MAG TPA: SIMPL domain-containing protein [Mycobacterium sp.]|jgi:uncharacterized protein YggE|nr:SIMPL domain-containing protein [Mycobacterium sp.]
MTCAAVLLTAAGVSGCDTQSPAQDHHRQVTVVGSGEVQGMPDTLTADVGIEVTAPDVTAAMNQASQRQRAVIDALTARGIDAKDISTTSVSLQPQYGENSAVTGYRADNSIRVTMRELDVAPATLAIVVNVGGNAARINGISYSIADDSALVSDARARAFTDAEKRARQYAELAGLSLGTVISISETSGGGPTPMPMPVERGAPMAAADVPLSPGEQTVSFSVTAVWELY